MFMVDRVYQPEELRLIWDFLQFLTSYVFVPENIMSTHINCVFVPEII